jgi:polyphenol oxidase
VTNYCDYTCEIVPTRKTSLKSQRNRQPDHGAAHAAKIAAPWRFRKTGSLQVLELIPLTKLPWLTHGFSTRVGGVSTLDAEKVLNLSFLEWDSRENVLENRRLLKAAVGAKDGTLVTMRQIHSDVVRPFFAAPQRLWNCSVRHSERSEESLFRRSTKKREILPAKTAGSGGGLRFADSAQNDRADALSQPCKGDAAITKEPGLLLGVQTADCVPILLVDPKQRVVAAIHAGWRGTLARIAQKTVGRMLMQFGCKPANLLAAIGPSIGPCCYEVSADFVTKFTSQFADAETYFDEARTGEEPNPLQWMNMFPPGHQPPPKNVHLDLRKANQSQLIAAGLRGANVFTSDLCTGCRRDLFFSYRKEGATSGRMLAVIGARSE